MQLLVRSVSGWTLAVSAQSSETVADLKLRLQAKDGMPACHQTLVHAGKLLEDCALLGAYGLEAGCTLHQGSRLRGGQPVKVKIITNHLPCGQEVTIDLEPSATKQASDEIKRKLEAATGVPALHQKVMLSGINQIVMGDKRTNVGFCSCGSANGVDMAVSSKS
ncbi:hypothetical protein ABPG75_009771 [Micractinium tetrahymenae]